MKNLYLVLVLVVATVFVSCVEKEIQHSDSLVENYSEGNSSFEVSPGLHFEYFVNDNVLNYEIIGETDSPFNGLFFTGETGNNSDKIELNLVDYNYFLIPSNQNLSPSQVVFSEASSFVINIVNSEDDIAALGTGGGGDNEPFFYCDCGGSPDAPDPGSCLASIEYYSCGCVKRITCNYSSSCDKGCQGYEAGMNLETTDAVIVQVPHTVTDVIKI